VYLQRLRVEQGALANDSARVSRVETQNGDVVEIQPGAVVISRAGLDSSRFVGAHMGSPEVVQGAPPIVLGKDGTICAALGDVARFQSLRR